MAGVSGGARALALVADVLVMLGVVVVVTAPSPNFGWFAYAPLASEVEVSSPLPLVLGGRQVLGLVALIAGLMLAGVALGRRRGP